jgi:DNA recombination protein RmuC
MLILLVCLVSINLVLVFLLIIKNRKNNNENINKKLEDYNKSLEIYEKNLKDEFERNRRESADNERASRKESQETLINFQNSINTKFDTLSKNIQDSLDKQKDTVQISLKNIQDSNEKKLEQMRVTVDEKLQSTLEKRLNSSFEMVNKQLESVQKGLGEMQTIASDVGGLKRALTSVKTAGTMGEVQLEALLTQILSPAQYEKNAHPNPSNPKGVVEFAVKLPSKENENKFIYLPIDSKFPTAMYEKLLQDYELADKAAIESDRKKLITDIRNFAKDIKTKYIEVPYTTDFAVMFLPFEGLYLEIIRIPGLIQQIQNEFNITVSGPTTLGAFLNSLQMGFRTLAIQEQTDNVWNLLRAVRTEFEKFGNVLEKTKEKLESASKEIDNAGVRTRAIERKLRDVEVLPNTESETDDIL